MKILIVTQYFYPENFKSNDLAFELKRRGHDVTVLTGLPNYPSGKISEGYGFFKNTKQRIDGVRVIRSWLLPRGKGGGFRIFLNYFSWAFFASIRAIGLGLNNKYDAIIVHEPSPITQFYPAWVVKKITKAPIYFWVLDLWPESLQVAGGINNLFVLNVFKKMVISFYNASEKILISSKGFKQSILQKGSFDNKIEYFPNWGEDSISMGDKSYSIPELPEGFKVMFAGNIGEAQDMDAIMQAALLLKEKIDIQFIIVGDGRKMSFVQEFVKSNKLENTVSLLGRYPLEAMATFFDKADVMLVSLKDDPIFNLTVPAKMQAYMSSGKPIVAMLNGDGAELINEAKCGEAVNAGDYRGLTNSIIKISEMSKEELSILGRNSKDFYLENFTLEKCIDNLERIISI
ncbi:glycosyltransferase family 4 protein [Myroides odoratimimus]|uniref:glycosyltransferase family 4 protein n=1 Tax=Myroides odoratimimus TaxID=76832 RepID=UPI002576301B|nr:glycosyltransferase family 4 protein [Myroides odoratimimus]MDM1466518.1 glycosyltransferase family 4 protein [Myroides odoratimimus]MDM1469668.1 glycosyltransferase family 4 protein [Myroides odoratimimus]MDM1479680.1 glycosyltransferase family 4 protein [Myroides odoratimimus]